MRRSVSHKAGGPWTRSGALRLRVLCTLALVGCGAEPSSRAEAAPSATATPPADTLTLAERARIPGWIAFVAEGGGGRDVHRIRPTGERVTLAATPAAEYTAAPAPDGSALLVVGVEEKEGVHLERLMSYPFAAGQPVQLGRATGRARSPSWSPDGRWLVFESDEASFRDLYRMEVGGGARRLTDDPEGNFDPAVSPDGRWIAFVSSRDGQTEIYRMRADGSGQQRLTAFHRDDVAPRWSPDGRWIAFVSDREGVDRIFLMAPDGTGQRRLHPDPGTPDQREEDPVWSPDGGRVAHVVRSRAGGAEVWVTDVRTGRRTRIAGSGRDDMPAWSPDGRYLTFVSERDGDPELYLARADGSAPTRLTRTPGADWLPRWVPPAGDGGASRRAAASGGAPEPEQQEI